MCYNATILMVVLGHDLALKVIQDRFALELKFVSLSRFFVVLEH